MNLKEPDIYKFSQVMFGINSFSFVSQYFTQQNARKNEDELTLISA